MSEYQRLKNRSLARKHEREREFQLEQAVFELRNSIVEAARHIGVECMAAGHQIELFRHDTGACVILRCVSCDLDQSVLDGSYESISMPLDGSGVH